MSPFKLIIFDLDGTFYDINDVIREVYDCQVSFFSWLRQISKEETRAVFAKHGIFPCVNAESKSCTEYFEREGVDKGAWASYRETHFDVTKIDTAKAVDPAVICKIASRYRIYLLSSNTSNTILKILSRLKIPKELFSGIVSSDQFVSSGRFNKHEAMAAIIKSSACDPSSVLSVGDRYNTDILPMLELGGCGILVKTPRAIGSLCDDLESGNFEECADYTYYRDRR